MAYARVTGKVGVLHSSPGPGMANLVPGLLDALARAKRALGDGTPAVLDCHVDTWDYAEGFVDFHRDVWGYSF